MRVLRLENRETERGPYTHGEDSLQYMLHSYSRISNPEPEEDGLRGVYGWSFGFKDFEQLTDWFSERTLHMLIHRCNFCVAEYEVPTNKVKFGNKQVAFLKEYATKVGEVGFDR